MPMPSKGTPSTLAAVKRLVSKSSNSALEDGNSSVQRGCSGESYDIRRADPVQQSLDTLAAEVHALLEASTKQVMATLLSRLPEEAREDAKHSADDPRCKSPPQAPPALLTPILPSQVLPGLPDDPRGQARQTSGSKLAYPPGAIHDEPHEEPSIASRDNKLNNAEQFSSVCPAPQGDEQDEKQEEDEEGKDFYSKLKKMSRTKTRAQFGLKTGALKKGKGEDRTMRRGSINMFVDADAMKDRIRSSLHRPEFNVTDLYKSKGMCQAVARNPWFETISLFIVAFNALWISYEMDKNKESILFEAEPLFIAVENAFCVFFLADIVIRLGAFSKWSSTWKDKSLMFDTLLVAMMVLEVWILAPVLYFSSSGREGRHAVGNMSILRVFRLMRLTRVARMARILRAVPALMVLIKGIITASQSVFFTMGLLTIVTYIFAIAMSEITAGSQMGSLYFETVPDAMLSLFLRGALPDVADFVEANGQDNPFFGVVLVIYIMLSSLTVMNMLVGILVEVVGVVAKAEKEESAVKQVRVLLLSLLQNVNEQGGNEETMMTEEMFLQLLSKPTCARSIQDLGVDVFGIVDLRDLIFAEGPIQFGDFMEIILQLRGSNQATVKDIVDLRKLVVQEIENMNQALAESVGMLQKAIKALTSKTESAKPVKTAVKALGFMKSLANAKPELG